MNKNTMGLLVAFLMAGLAVNASAIATVESLERTSELFNSTDIDFPQLKIFKLSEQSQLFPLSGSAMKDS